MDINLNNEQLAKTFEEYLNYLVEMDMSENYKFENFTDWIIDKVESEYQKDMGLNENPRKKLLKILDLRTDSINSTLNVYFYKEMYKDLTLFNYFDYDNFLTKLKIHNIIVYNSFYANNAIRFKNLIIRNCEKLIQDFEIFNNYVYKRYGINALTLKMLGQGNKTGSPRIEHIINIIIEGGFFESRNELFNPNGEDFRDRKYIIYTQLLNNIIGHGTVILSNNW